VRWPTGKFQILKKLGVDTLLVLEEKNAQNVNSPPAPGQPPLYRNVAQLEIRGNFRHRENEFNDFDNEILIPKMLSTESPKLAVGDVNGDGLEDFYMGSASGDTARIFIQQPDGRFIQKPQPDFIRDKDFENTGAAFFDADGDGDLDLVVASGGNQAGPGSSYLMPRLYLNDGKGNFTASLKGWPTLSLDASCVRIVDFNRDGKPDIFIGARNVPGSYGVLPSSVLLENRGNGNFADVTVTVAPDLARLGMVTDARWEDIDGDGEKELIVVGDWMAVSLFKYINGKLLKTGEIPHSSGWWNCLVVADVNGDGYPDLIAGNFGLNSNIKADSLHPARLYVDDFARNGKTECIPVYYKSDGKAYPYYLKGEMENQIPQLKKKFLKFSEYAGKSIDEVFPPEQLRQAQVLQVEQTQTCVFLNDGKGHFSVQTLPVRAQMAPVFGILSGDLNGDGITDLFLSGNFFGLKPQTGRYDANYGTLLVGDRGHQFSFLEPAVSGLFLRGEARDVAYVKAAGGGSYILVAMNNAELCMFKRQ
jgi:hypothetical protein